MIGLVVEVGLIKKGMVMSGQAISCLDSIPPLTMPGKFDTGTRNECEQLLGKWKQGS